MPQELPFINTFLSVGQGLAAAEPDELEFDDSQGVLDSERFTLLRSLEFFASFGDVELWEVVHRAKWQRFPFGHALYRKGETGNSFHILAQGEVEVFRDAKRVAQLIGFVLATVAGMVVLFVPSYTTATSDSEGNETIGSSTVWARRKARWFAGWCS